MRFLSKRWRGRSFRALLSLIVKFALALVLVLIHGFMQPAISSKTPLAGLQVVQLESTTLLDQGRSAYQNQQIDAAIDYWQRAAQQLEQQGDRLQQALAFSYLSLAYQYQGNWSRAEAMTTQGFKQLEQWQTSAKVNRLADYESNPSRIIQGQIFNTQGALQYHQGDLEAALSSWQQASAFYQAADDIQRYTGSLINQARTLQNLGYFLRARDILEQIKSQLDGAAPPIRALGLHSLGDTLRTIGDLEAAQAAYDQGLAITQSQSLPREQAALLVSSGYLAQIQQRPAEALQAYRQASVIAADPLQRVQAQIDEFGLLIATEDWATAKPLESEVASQLAALPPSRESLYAQIDFAHWLMALSQAEQSLQTKQLTERNVVKQHTQPSQQRGSMATAAKLLATTIEQAKGLGDRYAQAYATGYLGNAYEMTQQWAIAQDLTEDALLIAQSLNASDIAYQWQWQLGRILKSQGRFDEAATAYHTAFQSLQSLRYDLAATTPDQQFSFRESVEPVYREYVDLLLRSTAENEPARLQQAREVIESLQVAESNNFFQSACIDQQTVALDEVDQTNAAIVYPIILNDRLEVIVSLPNRSLQQHTVQISRDRVEFVR